MAAKRIPQLLEPGRPSGRMFPSSGCRRGFPREPAPWWDGPWPCPPAGPEDGWDEPPWDEPPWNEPPWNGPPWNGPPWDGPPWDEPPWNEPPQEQHRSRRHRRRPPGPRAPRPCPGPGDVPWKEEEGDRRWAPHDCPLPPPWDDREAIPPPEDSFGEIWYQDVLPDPWPEFPEEQPPPGPPSAHPGNPGTFREHRPPWSRRPAGRRQSHPRHLVLVPRAWCPRPPRGHKARSKPSSPARFKRSQSRKEPHPPEHPRDAGEKPEQPQDVPAAVGNAPEPPSPARSPRESPTADPGAAEPPVELEDGQTPVGSQDQDPCAAGADPAPPEETSSSPGIQEHLQVEPCSPGVPKAGSGDRSHPQSPAAPPDPAKGDLLEPISSGGAGAEPSPHSREQPPPGAGETEAQGAQDGPPWSLQPPAEPPLPPGSAAEPEAQPSWASPGTQTTPETSPGPGAGETNPAVSGQQQLCSVLPTPLPAGIDPRSAAILRRKAKIELSYQQFSLSIAVVATMLLQKEPSMEAALGLALRANLRQCRMHHLQQLQDFIDSLDSDPAGL
ncbi:uncharacterized protein [Taeniopygia guttata]|uniref:uncharacterized protein n=1 Tax=Taeniopygia guttata TaxID=59729 RepID=UPI003BB8D162